ncbi:PAS domain S-box protein [Hydrogenophaga pseudoflava]|uniref:PAS domain S-box protein n=1 Tax=Hydrogenophaga pseudoflava TaxID=47421 RepID=UPI0027E56781|nr:PAS domain S-box protein [Hydrogenophaga pseudoflava]MDQ7745367.1 PAS domain-containing protein [Hydrogenophaga pseudoflava]
MNFDRFAPVRRVALAYALVSFVWILFSDRAADALFPDQQTLRLVQTWKGLLFVLVTTVLLYAGMKRLYARLLESTDEQLRISRREAQTASLLKALAESSTDAIFAKDLQGRYLFFNQAAARQTGTSPDQVLGQDDNLLFPPDQADMVRANDRQAMAFEQAQTFEERLETPEGPRTFLATKGALRGIDGVLGSFGVSRDITEMVAARRLLEEGERRYRLMFERNPQPMFVFDLQTFRFLAVNQAAVLHYGHSREAFLAMSIQDLRPTEQVAVMTKMMASLEDRTEERDFGPVIHQTAAGQHIEVNLSYSNMPFEGRQARLVLVHDVTQVNRVARERDAALERLNSIMSRVTDGFMALGVDQRLTYVNRQAAALIDPSASPASLVGQLIWDLMPGAVGTRYADAFFTAMDNGSPMVVEDWFAPWQRWIECRVYPSSEGASVYFTDISKRRTMDIELEQYRNELSALAARLMSQEQATTRRIAQSLHDRLGQQLSSARLYLDVLQASVAEDRPSSSADMVSKTLQMVTEAIGEVRHVLLELRPPLLEEQGLAAALDNELRRSPAASLGIRIGLDTRAEVWGVRWPDTVEYAAFMIVREAIANALSHADAGTVVVSLDGDVGFMCIRVEDDGVGIPAGRQNGVPGHLGIVGMRERAQAIGGRLTIGPGAGGGTVVDFCIEELEQ